MNNDHDIQRRRLAGGGAALIASAWLGSGTARAEIKSGDNPEASEIWQKVRTSLFEKRTIVNAGDDTLVLDAPVRAEDAAVVPIAIHSKLPQTAASHVTKLTLVIDNNPSPISAIFGFTPKSGRADIETRVRVDEYTFVRAIAETSDGRLLMRTRWVKASGGCSAPPGKDPQAALASMGKIRLRVDGEVALGKPVLAQLMISHPNDSGMVMDQATRQFTPRRFVKTIEVAYAGQPVLSADLDFSISENPNLRFYFVPDRPSKLTAKVVDTNQAAWSGSLDVAPTA
ncbi:MAG TPA: quinoprotein dehydrogenase-associated SoxYZ-like carrier [Burkholderiaceae bacterium]|nr:quinoprotein dehydrogenase-associated SoxYZ-like carrier [Burkholderiaceae bacterium]